jgi:hypothetical protein
MERGAEGTELAHVKLFAVVFSVFGDELTKY